MLDIDVSMLGDRASDWATVAATIISAVSLWIAILVNHDAKRPQIMACLEFDSDENIVYLIVQNLGNGVAYDIHFSAYDESIFMDQFRPHVLESFVAKGIPLLVPGSKRSTIVTGGRMMDEMLEKTSALTVSYSERGLIRKRVRVEEDFILEYSSFSGALYTDSETKRVRRALEKMQEDVEGLREDLVKVHRNQQWAPTFH